MVECSFKMNTERFSSALKWCVKEYEGDFRKSSGVPSIHHPLGVCDLVIGAGGDEDTAIAALFHDFAEDKGGEEILSKIRNEYGERVERIVRDCSDTIPVDYSKKESWVERKSHHLQRIENFEADSCLVLAADTLHNVRDYIRGWRIGDSWWSKFRANIFSDRDITEDICIASTMWYLEHKTIALLHRDNVDVINGLRELTHSFTGLLSELSEAVLHFDSLLNEEQWFLYIEACCYAKKYYNIG
jgi:(p)ppGpp synthase/HD superfamily hydrolase